MNKDGVTVNENMHMVDILIKQYSDICTTPRTSLDDSGFEYFLHSNDVDQNRLQNIYIDIDYLKKKSKKYQQCQGLGPMGSGPIGKELLRL